MGQSRKTLTALRKSTEEAQVETNVKRILQTSEHLIMPVQSENY